MRATGDNPRMIRALGVDVGRMITIGLMMSNALVALSGAILAQYQGFADVQMGIGMIVWGLASVILGQALVGTGGLGLSICGAVMGSLLFRLMVALALRGGPRPQRPQADHGRLRVRGPRFAQGILEPSQSSTGRGVFEMALLEMRGVYKTFNAGTPDEVRALRGFDLTIEPGSFVVVIGTNGSGKSTTLNAVAGRFPSMPARSAWPAATIERLARAPACQADRPGLSGPARRHLPCPLDRRKPGTGRRPRASRAGSAARSPGAEPPSSATGSGRSAWAWKTVSTTRSAPSRAASARP